MSLCKAYLYTWDSLVQIQRKLSSDKILIWTQASINITKLFTIALAEMGFYPKMTTKKFSMKVNYTQTVWRHPKHMLQHMDKKILTFLFTYDMINFNILASLSLTLSQTLKI